MTAATQSEIENATSAMLNALLIAQADMIAAGISDACAAAEDDNTSAREDAADYRRRAARADAMTERGK